ncbi:flavin reductase family protein [Rhodospirillaceae bacterium KN72]|uniref:Flavin reductase family protein n=1 Tax=Pacificispira spongiicola TaxID=2729598 RepID=A0A7Y0DXA4_9PROT|nr:flavin reductase family protein [Pacificispira spongiicola]NMM43317.1 flavin reductase family protein [Pacificispira spongiicola]
MPAALRRAFGVYPTGVTVITTVTEQGAPVGFTANSFTSVSLDPPLLLVCPSLSLGCYPAFSACARFAVNVLAEDQRDIADRFASFRGDRFAMAGWTPDDRGIPILDGVAAHFSCAVHDRYPAGDHMILLGRVDAWRRSDQDRPLAFAAGSYTTLPAHR